MRRFSQRNSLVTLSDINITPLLDLAFVLLIIFIIISPSIRSAQEQSVRMNLPKGGQAERKTDLKDVLTVEVSPQGFYVIRGRPVSSKQIEASLMHAAEQNPRLVVDLRADRKSPYEMPFAVLDICQNHGITCHLKSEARP